MTYSFLRNFGQRILAGVRLRLRYSAFIGAFRDEGAN